MIETFPVRSSNIKARFDQKYIPEPNSGCWLWLASTSVLGYGHFRVDGKTAKAHRYSYERFVGPVPRGLELDHKCRVRSCVNPDHLEPVTHAENVRRGVAAERKRAITHCRQGHAFSDENTAFTPQGRRRCKMCCRLKTRRQHAARRMLSHGH